MKNIIIILTLHFVSSLMKSSVKIELNVNHSVETAMPETSGKSDTNTPPPMLAKPNFDVEIKRGATTITFSCSFASEEFAGEQGAEEEGFGS